MENTLQARNEAENADELKELQTGAIDPAILLKEQDRVVLEKFDELKRWSYGLDQTLIALEAGLSGLDLPETRLLNLVRNLRDENKQMRQDLFAPVYDHSVESLEKIYKLRQELEQRVRELDAVHQRLEEIRAMPLYRLGSSAVRGLRKLRPQQSDSAAAGDAIRGVAEEHSHYAVDSPYGDVNNSGTPLAIFKNWVTLFHYQGRRYGSTEPLVTDNLEAISELHQREPLAGKQILEIGPLEGGNTKQMLDLGAASVCGIEFNKELFLKCLLAKNTFALNQAEFVLGDCNLILAEKSFLENRRFDMAVASGVLYHMEDPILTIELLCRVAKTIYVWTHVASDRTPKGPWVDVKDEQGRHYRGRRNEYIPGDALGGVGKGALWLEADSVYRAFRDRGFAIEELGGLQNYKGDVVKFIARS